MTYHATIPGQDTRDPFAGITIPTFLEGKAACADADAESWFVEKSGQYAPQVFTVCGECPIQRGCLDWALANDETFGVWGGLTPTERKRLKAGKPLRRRSQRKTAA